MCPRWLRILALAALLSLHLSAPTTRHDQAQAVVGLLQLGHATTGVTTWTALAIGGGGYVTGLDIATNGTKVARTDTYGGYWWSGSSWVQFVTIQSMPAAQAGLEKDAGVNEVRIAPSNTSRFYMNYNGQMFRSDNSGVTWTLLSNYATVTWSANDTNIKTFGPYIAIDPANADRVYASTPSSGLRLSTDAGATWSTVAGVGNAGTVGGSGGGHLIKYDPSSSVVGGVTQGIYATRYGTGVYRSTDGGANWALTTSTPTTMTHIDVGSDGVLYLVANDGTDNLRIYNGTTWSSISVGGLGNPAHSVAVDPADANKITVVNQAGALSYSSDHGANWTGFQNSPAGITRTATDVPWLQFTKEDFMSAGDIRYDPSGSNKLYFVEGIGVWFTTPGSGVATSVAYTSQTVGIENLVANDIVSPTGGGKPVVSSWDRPTFYINNPAVYPSTHGAANPQTNALISGWSIDYASASPTTIVCVCNFGAAESGYSTDGGQTWTAFGSLPSGVPGSFFNGSIAASSATNFVYIPFINAPRIYFTTNTGTTWTAATVTGVPTSGDTGWSNTFSTSVDRQNVCSDRVTANKFYAYNIGANGDASFAGIYASTDSGANWSRVKVGLLGTYNIDSFNGTLTCVPGNAGHLFWTGGQVGGSTSGSFYRSTDGGVNWTALSGVTEVYAFGFGKAVASGYPALYIAGFVGGTAASDWGIWRSDDADQATPTWTRISDGYPAGNFSQIKTVSGDMNTYGTVYVGTIGASWLYGKLN